MTLGNMRQNGVRGLDITCLHCGHHTEVNVDRWPDDVSVPSFGPRMRCKLVRQTWCYRDPELERTKGLRARDCPTDLIRPVDDVLQIIGHDEIRGIVARNWSHLLSKLPPEEDHDAKG